MDARDNAQPDGPDVDGRKPGMGSSAQELRCPTCGRLLSGTLCPQCATSTDDQDRTYVQNDLAELPSFRAAVIGEADLDSQTPITLEIGGQHLKLPIADVMTLGRAVKRPFVRQPDVDLSGFEGPVKSVSRRHVTIRRTG